MCFQAYKKAVLLPLVFLLTACQSSSQTAAPTANKKDYDMAMKVAAVSEKSGNNEATESALNEARQQAPNSPEPVIRLTKLYVSMGEYQKASSLAEENLPKFKNQPGAEAELQRLLGLAYWHLDQPNLGISALIIAYPISQHPEVALNDIAVVLDHVGKHQAAQYCYQQGLQLAPSNDVLMNNYALSLACTGDIAQAEQLLNNRVLISSSNQSVLANRDLALEVLQEGRRDNMSAENIAQTFRRQFGFDQSHAQLTQENFAAIAKICHFTM